jgi:hypothetical protein
MARDCVNLSHGWRRIVLKMGCVCNRSGVWFSRLKLAVLGICKVVNALLLMPLLVAPLATVHAQNHPSESRTQHALDPWNKPMDELGVTGKDDTLCSDRWYSCTTYDRLQFDRKYPGKPLNELLRFGEPDWPDSDHKRGGDSRSEEWTEHEMDRD